MATPRWKDGSKGMLTVNALFAGFSGALVVNLAVRDWADGSPEMYAIFCAMAALFFFALAAEKITDALDEGDVDIYLRSMLAYNVGVVLVLASIGIFLWAKGHPVLAGLALAMSVYPWLCHALWLIFASAAQKDNYRAQITTKE